MSSFRLPTVGASVDACDCLNESDSLHRRLAAMQKQRASPCCCCCRRPACRTGSAGRLLRHWRQAGRVFSFHRISSFALRLLQEGGRRAKTTTSLLMLTKHLKKITIPAQTAYKEKLPTRHRSGSPLTALASVSLS